MVGWSHMKKAFDSWEMTTARYLEEVLKSPVVLAPSGAMLTMIMKLRAASDRARSDAWGRVGLPTKRDQERTLHLLQQLESRILDLEEKLEDAMEKRD